MRYIAFIIALLATHLVYAQDGRIDPDPTKIESITYPKRGPAIPCGGSSNLIHPDMHWQPLLTNKIDEVEHKAPDQEYIDSVKAAKLNIIRGMAAGKNADEEKTTTAQPAVGVNFEGNTHNGSTPLDNHIAIANNGNIVSVANRTIACYDQTGAAQTYSDILSFLPASFNVTGTSDPQIFYDASADRFIFFCQESYKIVPNNRVFICFSKSNNPAADGWWCYYTQGDPTGSGYSFDYPKIAVNDSELFITGNLYIEPAGVFQMAVLYQLYKYPGYNGSSLSYLHYTSITNNPSTLLPVSHGQGGSFYPGMYLVSTRASGNNIIRLYQVTAPGCCNPTLNNWTVPTTAYSLSADAMQLGTSSVLNTDDCRALSGFWLNNTIHFVFNCDGGSGYTAINYNRLDIASLTNTSSTYGLNGYFYAYPSVASFATSPTDASVLIGFGRSGPNIYPEIRAIACDNSMNWSTTALVQPSASFNASETDSAIQRWGDYSGTARRHNSPAPSVWMNGSFADASNKWDSWIAELHTPGVGVPNVSNEASGATVYPNPAYEGFNVEFTLGINTENLDITIYSTDGRKIKELYNGRAHSGDNIFSFNEAMLPSGNYLLRIKADNNIIRNEKVVIAK